MDSKPIHLWLLLIFILDLCIMVHGESPGYVILAPNVFHVGIEEKVSVTVTGLRHPVKVLLFLHDYPDRKTNFSHTEGLFKPGELGFLKLKIEPEDVPPHDDMELDQYVYLVAKCNDSQIVFHKEVKILLEYKDKMVFVQTDKPIYTPLQTVNIRVIPLDFALKSSKDKIDVVIKNPQDVITQRWRNISTETGFITKAVYLGDHSMIGNWSIVATYGYLKSQNTTVNFEVKEYVLPKFSVTIRGPTYIVPSTKIIHIAVVAKYTFGKPVKGDVLVRLAVTGKGLVDVKFFAKSSQLTDGKFIFKVDANLFKKHALLPKFPRGRRLLIEVDVVEQATGVRESAIDNSIYFVTTPYHVSHENTAKYFKPSIPFQIKIDVHYPNKKPTSHLTIQIKAVGKNKAGKEVDMLGKDNDKKRSFLQDKTKLDGRVEFPIDVQRDIVSINVQVETKGKGIPENENAAVDFTVKAYNSKSGSYLHIETKTEKALVGTTSTWNIIQNRNISALNFMVMSRGRILTQGTSRYEIGLNIVSTMKFLVTMEMSPRCRVLAYYVTRDNEIVADSAVLEVEQRLPNKVQFDRKELNNPLQKTEIPGTPYTIKVKTTPWSRVGLIGVDESVHLLRKKKKLTAKKIFKEVKALDSGCGVGPGKDNSEVFEKSGLMVISNTKIFTKDKGGFSCSSNSVSKLKRKKRSLLTQEEQSCCDLSIYFSRASCALRARFMVKASVACREAFLNCCRITWGEKESKVEVRQRQFQERNGDSFDDEGDISSSEQTRKYFPETWLFHEQFAGSTGEIVLPITLPDTITTWVLQAMSISNKTGFGLAVPSRITTFKEFFVSLTLPYSVQRGEQLSVIATVFNYGADEHLYQVRLLGSSGFCSQAMPGAHSRPIEFRLKGNDVKSVTFPLVPIQLGKVQIRVSVTQKVSSEFDESSSTDTVLRELLVVPEGAERRLVQSFVLDPQGVLRDENRNFSISSNTTVRPTLKNSRIVQDGHQIDNLMLTIPSRAIPGSLKASLHLTGNLIGPVVTSLIKGGLEDILRMPLGCGEQNMIYLAPNVYALEYLTNTRQVTSEVESRAYRFIQQGYQQELGFRRKDKSFSAFGETRPGSTWLTAFVVKVFSAAMRFDGIAIDENMLCESTQWLLSNQRADGAFPEVHDLIHKSLLGGVHGDVAMTAFVVMSLHESNCHTQNLKAAMAKAVKYLEKELDSLHKAHVLALTTYSLALVNSPMGAKANRKLMSMSTLDKDKNTRYWKIGGDALNVETAGYALLAQLYLGRLKHGGSIVTWLTEHRNSKGGFVSTQDTCVALQALAKYSEKTAGANIDLSVSILPENDASWKRTFHIDRSNALIQRSVDITPFLGGELFIDSIGTGVSQLQIEILYNVPSSKNETCMFDVTVDVKELFNQNAINEDIFIFGRSSSRKRREIRSRKGRKSRRRKCRRRNRKRCRKDRNKRKRKRGGKKKKNHNKKDKKQKTQGKAPDTLLLNVCTRYRRPGKSGMAIMDIGIFTGFEPDKKSLIELQENVRPTVDRFEFSDRSIVLYVKEVPSTKEFCAAFKVNRVFGIGAVQPVPIKVYDYYEPGDACTKFYSPDDKSELILGICKGDQCKCTQDGCTPCNIRFSSVDEMMAKACKDHEFVIKGKVVLVDENNQNKVSWLTYFVEIQQIFKQAGGKGKMSIGGVIEYKKRAGCTCPELNEDHEYLIMGQEEGLQLILNKNTVVMPWQARSSNDIHVFRSFRARINQGHLCP